MQDHLPLGRTPSNEDDVFKPAVVLAALVLLVAPASADARPLSLAAAQRAITLYERIYWKGQDATVTVGHCERVNVRQVSCLSEVASSNTTTVVRDWATLLAHQIIRVHPGDYATTVTLEESLPVEG